MEAFTLVEKTIEPGCFEIKVRGELDLSVADRLRDVLERATAECKRVVVGLDECEFIDSTGIALLVQAQRTMKAHGRHFAVYGPRNQVLRTLAITGLTENGLIHESAEAALAALRQSE